MTVLEGINRGPIIDWIPEPIRGPIGDPIPEPVRGPIGDPIPEPLDVGPGGGAIIDWIPEPLGNRVLFDQPGGEEGERNPAQDKKLSKGEVRELEKAGINIHELKEGLGAGGEQELFKDRKGNVIIKPKDGSGPGEPTGININDL
jgi:hypothetical protein